MTDPGRSVPGLDQPGVGQLGPGFDQPGVGQGTPGVGQGTLVEEEVLRRPVPTDAGDHERFAHYAPKDKIMEAIVTGTPVRALCGKVWVPSRDPARFPLCPTCKEIYDQMPDGPDDAQD